METTCENCGVETGTLEVTDRLNGNVFVCSFTCYREYLAKWKRKVEREVERQTKIRNRAMRTRKNKNENE